MINKSNLWFLTLSSIILVLSIYYIGGVNETDKMVFSANTSDEEVVVIEESEALTAMRISKEEEHLNELTVLQEVLLNQKSTTDEKNDAYEKIKLLNDKKSLEEKLESKILQEFKVTSFVEIDDDKIKAIISNKDDSFKLANNVIKLINANVKDDFYVTVKFQWLRVF